MVARENLRLSSTELAEYLDEPRTMIVATLGHDGFPHQAPVSYVMDGPNPVFWTYRKSQKIRNLERDPRASCLVEDGVDHFELRGALLIGRATVSTDPELLDQSWRRLTSRYGAPDPTTDQRASFLRQVDKRCVVTVWVERTVSWDHRKMRPGLQATPPSAVVSR